MVGKTLHALALVFAGACLIAAMIFVMYTGPSIDVPTYYEGP